MTRVKLLLISTLLCLVVQVRSAQEVIEQVDLVTDQFAVVVNENTNQIYLAGTVVDGASLVAGVSVYDGTTNERICSTPLGIPPFAFPHKIAANPLTNRIYVSNMGGVGSITVVDAACSVIQDITLLEPGTGNPILPIGGILHEVAQMVMFNTDRWIAPAADAENAPTLTPPSNAVGSATVTFSQLPHECGLTPDLFEEAKRLGFPDSLGRVMTTNGWGVGEAFYSGSRSAGGTIGSERSHRDWGDGSTSSAAGRPDPSL